MYVRLVGADVSDDMETAVDRALLAAFVATLTGVHATAGADTPGADGPGHGRAAGGERLVADLGCGPGRITAFLAAGGIDVVGVDLSSGMLAAARAAHPQLRFVQGGLAALPLADGSLVGAVCWYSIINTPPARLDRVASELARVLAPGGELLLGFQAGRGEGVHRAEAYGRPVPLTSFRHDPDAVGDRLEAAGLHVHARAVREPERDFESTPQAYLLARAPTAQPEPAPTVRS